MTATVKKYRNRDAWLKARQGGIGASDAAQVLGISSWGSPYDLWRKKTTKTQLIPETSLQKAGHYLEPVVAKMFRDAAGLKMHNDGKYAVHYHPAKPHIFASLDRTCVKSLLETALDLEYMPSIAIVEIKNVSEWMSKEWSKGLSSPEEVFRHYFDPSVNEKIPLIYNVQVQHQMLVTGLKVAYIAVLIGGNDFRYFRVERNEKFLVKLEYELDKFWELVKTDTPPDPDAHPATTKALKEMYSEDNGKEITLDPSMYCWALKHEYGEQQEKRGKNQKELAKNWFREKMGDNSIGLLPKHVIHRKNGRITVKERFYDE